MLEDVIEGEAETDRVPFTLALVEVDPDDIKLRKGVGLFIDVKEGDEEVELLFDDLLLTVPV